MSQSSPQPSARPERDDVHAQALALVRQALGRLKFGAVHLTVHEGRLVQIEVTEKTRLSA
ncbi:MAG: hypothetical protein ABS86_03355 [Sphingobium sp. SCN 64-10]|jgi:hypothetical protein|nr:MAG: hypothetical protein ABS86_03355 [Sphingobium sp. SCN 64-10]